VNDLTAEIMHLATDTSYVPFGAACPDHTLFPPRSSRASSAPSAATTVAARRYGMNWAYDPLTREIARRYLQAGTPLAHDELVVTIGCCEPSTSRCAPSPSGRQPSRSSRPPTSASSRPSRASA